MVGSRRADYALLNPQGDVAVFLEAKNMGEQLSSHRSQVAAYASELGIRYPALTNGSEWEVYDNSLMVPIEQRRILNISLANDDSAKCALKLLLLWRPNLASGQPTEAAEPILGTEAPASTVAADAAPRSLPPPVPQPPAPSGIVVPRADWVTLEDYRPSVDRRPPQRLSFPDGVERSIRFKKQIVIEVSEWLIREGVLGPEACPVTAGRDSGYCTVNRTPLYPNGKGFKSEHLLSNGLYLDVNFGAKGAASVCRAIVTDRGKDPASVNVQVG